MTTPSDNTDPREPSTADADSPPGGGRSSYSWVLGLVLIIVVLGLVTLLLAGGDGGNVPSR